MINKKTTILNKISTLDLSKIEKNRYNGKRI